MAGAAFETHVFGQILRFFQNRAEEVDIHFWRTRDGEEIDFLVESKGMVYPIEVKLGSPARTALPRLEKIRKANWKTGRVISLAAPDASPVRLSETWELQGPDPERIFAS